jgi:hypothetical protein
MYVICCMLSSGLSTGICNLNANISEHFVPSSYASRYEVWLGLRMWGICLHRMCNIYLHNLFLYLLPPCHLASEWFRLFLEWNLFLYKYLTFSSPVILDTYLPMKMEQTECSEMLALKLQMLMNKSEESTQHSEHGQSLKSRMYIICLIKVLIK